MQLVFMLSALALTTTVFDTLSMQAQCSSSVYSSENLAHAPTIDIISPQNKTYYSNLVSLVFELDEPASWIGYSLDGQQNVTVVDSIIIDSDDGVHQMIVYVNDTAGNMGFSAIIYFTVDSTAYEPWKTSFIGSGEHPIVDLAVYNGKLYAAADSMLYLYDGSSWDSIDAPASIVSLESCQDRLVVGGQGGLYSFDGATFNLVFSVPTYIKVLGTYNNTHYAGTLLDNPPTLYYCNGSADNPSDWHVDAGFSSILNFSSPFGSIDSFQVYDSKMYLTSGNNVYSSNGTTWNIAKTCDDVCAFLDMEAYNGKLYLASRDQAARKPVYQGGSGFSGRVIQFDGGNWTIVLDHNYWIYSLQTYAGQLYVGTANKIFTYNGTHWNVRFSTTGAYYAISLGAFDNTIYVGMGNGHIFEYASPYVIVTVLHEGKPVYQAFVSIDEIYSSVTNEGGIARFEFVSFEPHTHHYGIVLWDIHCAAFDFVANSAGGADVTVET